MQVTYGVATATEVAYFAYIYANVSGEWYQQVTSFTRAALLLGRFLSGALAQSLVCTELCDFRSLNYISLAMVSFATLISIVLPPVKKTIYFHRGNSKEYFSNLESFASGTYDDNGIVQALEISQHNEHTENSKQMVQRATSLLYRDFKDAFTKPYILKWSIWWALAMCGNFQVGNYIQPLWEEIKPAADTESSCDLYNGAVEAVTTLVGAGWYY